ncbi:MAG TPA: hypothetical protein VFZ13_05520 [Gemmatimonadales bacterium]
MSIRTSLTLAALVVAASPLAAQGRGNGVDKVPPGHMPPPGMCRIWIDDVPPGRQPKPTDCTTARRRVPDNARVIYGARTTSSRDDVRWTDRVFRDRDGRYDDDRKSESVGDRKNSDGSDRKYDDRKDDDGEVFRRGDDVKDRDDDDRRDTDTKLSDRKDTTRKP